jgi:hypothetical protein
MGLAAATAGRRGAMSPRPEVAPNSSEPAGSHRVFQLRIDRDTAADRLSAPGFWRTLARRPRRPRRLELVHLPYRQATAQVRYRKGGRDVQRAVSCLVCANTGLAFRFDAARVALEDGPQREPLTARLDSGELDRRALDYLQRWAASARRVRGARLVEPPQAEDRAYPIWIAIYERRAGTLDVDGIDAITGVRIGSATRQALLIALAANVVVLPQPGEPHLQSAPTTNG